MYFYAFFICGCLVMLLVPILSYSLWVLKPRERTQSAAVLCAREKTALPASIGEALHSVQNEKKVETCLWFNCIVCFLFDEWRDSMDVKQLFMRKVQKEFDDLLAKSLGRVVKQLTIREYFLGTSLPTVKGIEVLDSRFMPNEGGLQELSLLLEVEYNGGVQLTIDAELLLRKAALITIRVCSVKGLIEVKFTKEPFSHWSLSLLPEPPADIKLSVEAEVEGHSLNHLAKFIEMQIHRTIRKKHTLPSRKTRFKPFLPSQVPYSPDTQVQYCGVPITVGELRVMLVDTEKLPQPASLSKIYCTISVDRGKSEPIYSNMMLTWPSKEVKIPLTPVGRDSVQDILGAKLVDMYVTFEEERIRVAAVKGIQEGSVAQKWDLQPGYILDCINGKRGSCIEEFDSTLSKLPLSEQRTVSLRFLTPHPSLVIPVSQDMSSSQHNLEPAERKPKRQYQTDMKAASRHVSWQMAYSFEVQPADEFLNVHIWGRMQNDTRDMLLGKVSCKLSTLAMSCLMINGRHHEEKFHLTPSDLLKNVVKGKEQIMCDPSHLGQLPQHARLPEELKSIGFFPGSVRLVCLYQQSHGEHRKITQRLPFPVQASEKFEETFSGEEAGLVSKDTHETCEMPGRVAEHNFVLVHVSRDTVNLCPICRKKIKSNDVNRCRRCGLICDQKCVSYCQKQVKCHRIIGEEARDLPPRWQYESDGAFEILESNQNGTVTNALHTCKNILCVTRIARNTQPNELETPTYAREMDKYMNVPLLWVCPCHKRFNNFCNCMRII